MICMRQLRREDSKVHKVNYLPLSDEEEVVGKELSFGINKLMIKFKKII